MKSVSIKDIAREAGVVPSTVSSVLNGKAKTARISNQLAEKIFKLADEMGYQPNHTAVSLRTGKTKIIGLIVEDISNVFFASLAKIVEDEVYSLGYKIVYCSTENSDEKGIELIRMLSNRQVDGFLITPSPGMKDEVARLLNNEKPVVLIDRYLPGLDVPSTLVDNDMGIKMGMDHLIRNGYKKIAYISVEAPPIQMQKREQAFTRMLKEMGIDNAQEYIYRIPYPDKMHDLVLGLENFLGNIKDLDAVFFATNYLGLIGIESFKKLGWVIGKDIAMICFDDHDVFRLYNPGITVIEQPISAIAKTAIQLLVKQIDEARIHTEKIAFDSHVLKEPRLVVRGST
jgi:LacI family transcriptional regulator